MSDRRDLAAAAFGGFEITDLEEAAARAQAPLDALAGASLFITGGTGFVGRWLLALLAHANASRKLRITATILTRSRSNFAASYPNIANDPAFHFVEGDVRFFEFPKGKFTEILHGAADTNVEADRRPLDLLDTIVGGTRRVLSFALSSGAKRFLFLSSGAIYGPQPATLAAFPENYTGACLTTDRRSVYGQSKRLAEQLVTTYHVEHGLETVIARLFAFVGPGLPLNAHLAISNFLRNALAGEDIIVTGDGSAERSYLYAADLAVWLLHLLVNGRAGSVYNVGSDHAVSIRELAALVAKSIPCAKGYVIKGTPQPGELRARYIPSIIRARADLGLDVWTSLEEAIKRTARCLGQKKGNIPIAAHQHRQKLILPISKLVFVVDLDGVVASLTPNNDYSLAAPLSETITLINRLYDSGHRIILYTARGSATGVDWTAVTQRQLSEWGVKHHEIRFGKPAADYYVDDRMLSVSEFSNLVKALTSQNSHR
jgi:dTDP-glucose 4,6-dehydratase